MPVEQAVSELKKNTATQFDPDPVEVFVRLVEQGRVHPIVERQKRERPESAAADFVSSNWGTPALRPAAPKP